ncbi:SIMPL domain-containing protein [Rhizobium sp. FKY42]|uniref:SIMPL domain-containing protein n=1 Tax=Rhizobium sp. FKY42 TaxID=2562310 RepID=UPI0010BF91CF|nr:SIMPL domain-containing protein [Rhizobium sp. FKY42]
MSFRLRPSVPAKATTLALMASLVLPAVSFAQAPPPPTQPRAITVSGEGTASIAPDMAIVNLSVTRMAETAQAALTQNNEAVRSVLDALKANGVADRDIQTGDFSIFPRYSDRQSTPQNINQQPVIIGYQVTNSLTVRVRELPKLGELIDQSVKLGVNQGGQITFTNHEPKAAYQNARRKAVEDAMEKAKTLAEAAGVTLGPVVNISETNLQPVAPAPMMRMAMAKEADSVPVAGGETTYTVTVEMRFDIRP